MLVSTINYYSAKATTNGIIIILMFLELFLSSNDCTEKKMVYHSVFTDLFIIYYIQRIYIKIKKGFLSKKKLINNIIFAGKSRITK